ncbi:MAG: tetratricopeptide repeat protein [Planctomycetota bacterium]
MKRLMIAVIVVLSVAGCQNMPTVSEAKLQATERWNATRAEMVYAVAIEQFRSGRLAQAAIEARKALSMDEGCVEARLLLGKVEIEKGRHAAACAELRKVLAEAPESAEAFYLLGVAQEKSGQLDEALSSYRRAYELDESNLSPITAAAEVLVRMGRAREAQLYIDSYAPKAETEVSLFELGGRLAMMGKEYDKAVDYYQRALDLDFENKHYRRRLGRAQFLAGKYAEAVETLEPLTFAESREVSPWVYATLGDCYMAMSKPAPAREAYEQACKGLKSSAGVRASLAKAVVAEGDLRRAIRTAKEALALDAKCLEATLVLGYALLVDGQVSRAIRELTQAAADHPADATLWCLLGRAHAAGGDEHSAEECYVAALRADPDSELARNLLGQSRIKQLSRGQPRVP